MTPFLQLALALAIIILAAKLGGYVSYRLGQPSVLGELLVGILIGPTVIDLLHLSYFTDEHLGEVVHDLAEIGVLLLMFIAGIDLHLSDLSRSRKVALYAGVLGVIVPLSLGVISGLFFSFSFSSAIFLGLILSATSVSISAQTLMELKVLRSKVGVSMLGAAVFDDILVVLGLSAFLAVALSGGGNGWVDFLWILLRMILFLGLTSIIGYWLLPKLAAKFHDLPVSQGLFAFTFVTILAYGWIAEEIGRMAAITGAFLAGLWLARSPLKDRIVSGISVLAYAVFVPIFFVNIGLIADVSTLWGEDLVFLLVIFLIAVVGKILGAGLGGYFGGLSRREAFQLGVGMISRGEVGLIVASVGIAEGFIPQNLFAAVVGMVILTTLITPPFLRILFMERPEKRLRTEEIEEKEVI